MTWTLHIPRPVPSANARHVNGRDRVSRALYRKLRNAWARDLIAAWRNLSAYGETIPLCGTLRQVQRRLVLTRIMGPRQREYDTGNIEGGWKPILDAMKPATPGGVVTVQSGPNKGKRRIVQPVSGAGLIYDDAPRWVEVTYRQERGAEAGCLIEIEDL
jgi:hypothetical protein